MKKKIQRNKQDKDGYEYNFDGLNMKNFKTVPSPPWLPSPEEAAKIMKSAKLTIVLDEGTVDFIKEAAKEKGKKHQKMLQEILKSYRIQYVDKAA